MGFIMVLHAFHIGCNIIPIAVQVAVYGGVAIGVCDVDGFSISIGLDFYPGYISCFHCIHPVAYPALCLYVDPGVKMIRSDFSKIA